MYEFSVLQNIIMVIVTIVGTAGTFYVAVYDAHAKRHLILAEGYVILTFKMASSVVVGFMFGVLGAAGNYFTAVVLGLLTISAILVFLVRTFIRWQSR